MSDMAVSHGMAGEFEPSLFGAYSKKIGMWLFLLSDTLTFGALLFAYSYGRISNPDWPTPFHKESIINATIMTGCLLSSSLTMVLAVMAAGSPTVSCGSTIAMRGSIIGLRRLAFTPCSADPSTAFRVTSDPVPAVVGTAIIGNGGLSNGCALPITSR